MVREVLLVPLCKCRSIIQHGIIKRITNRTDRTPLVGPFDLVPVYLNHVYESLILVHFDDIASNSRGVKYSREL